MGMKEETFEYLWRIKTFTAISSKKKIFYSPAGIYLMLRENAQVTATGLSAQNKIMVRFDITLLDKDDHPTTRNFMISQKDPAGAKFSKLAPSRKQVLLRMTHYGFTVVLGSNLICSSVFKNEAKYIIQQRSSSVVVDRNSWQISSTFWRMLNLQT
jgi:hypothetical protein